MSKLSFRLATFDDAQTLYEWRTDSHTRAMSTHQKTFSYQEHLAWLKNSLSDPSRQILICMEESSTPIGTLRVDIKANNSELSELSWSIAPTKRGQGLGGAMLSLFLAQYPRSYSAQVSKENAASQKICERMGFRLISEKEGFYFYHYP